MAQSIEGETTYYKSHILLSGVFREFLTEAIRDETRLIDCVELTKGNPIKLYTLDLDTSPLHVVAHIGVSEAPCNSAAKLKAKWERRQRKHKRMGDDYNMHTMFELDLGITTMRSRYTEEFFCRFNMAYCNYEAGNWAMAKVMLKETRFLLGIEDGASTALLRLLQLHDNEAPKDWKGYRELGVAAEDDYEDEPSEHASPQDSSMKRAWASCGSGAAWAAFAEAKSDGSMASHHWGGSQTSAPWEACERPLGGSIGIQPTDLSIQSNLRSQHQRKSHL